MMLLDAEPFWQRATEPDHVETGESPADIGRCLERILASTLFLRSPRLREFLRYVVSASMVGDQQEAVKEYHVGLNVFRRHSSFDPRLDPIVRVEATRLRAKLKAYYESEGANDPLEIVLPVGSYVPRIVRRELAIASLIPTSKVIVAFVPLRCNTSIARHLLLTEEINIRCRLLLNGIRSGHLICLPTRVRPYSQRERLGLAEALQAEVLIDGSAQFAKQQVTVTAAIRSLEPDAPTVQIAHLSKITAPFQWSMGFYGALNVAVKNFCDEASAQSGVVTVK